MIRSPSGTTRFLHRRVKEKHSEVEDVQMEDAQGAGDFSWGFVGTVDI
jgi:hypothetical protein